MAKYFIADKTAATAAHKKHEGEELLKWYEENALLKGDFRSSANHGVTSEAKEILVKKALSGEIPLGKGFRVAVGRNEKIADVWTIVAAPKRGSKEAKQLRETSQKAKPKRVSGKKAAHAEKAEEKKAE